MVCQRIYYGRSVVPLCGDGMFKKIQSRSIKMYMCLYKYALRQPHILTWITLYYRNGCLQQQPALFLPRCWMFTSPFIAFSFTAKLKAHARNANKPLHLNINIFRQNKQAKVCLRARAHSWVIMFTVVCTRMRKCVCVCIHFMRAINVLMLFIWTRTWSECR